MNKKYKCYLASGWFTPKQKQVMDKVRNIILEFPEIELFSPYYNGLVLTKENDSPEMRKKVFELDIGTVAFSNLVVAIVDDFEPGAMFEMGAAGIICWLFDNDWRIRRNIGVNLDMWDSLSYIPRTIAYSDVSGRGLNVMLQQTVWGFANGEEQLRKQLNNFILNREAEDFLKFQVGDFV